MLPLLLETEIPAEVLAELAPALCEGGEEVQTGEDDWTTYYCTASPVAGQLYCRDHGGLPGLETFDGNPFGDGPQAWWLR